MHIGIGYGSDIEEVRQLIVETVRQVEGVLPDRPVDSLYIDMVIRHDFPGTLVDRVV